MKRVGVREFRDHATQYLGGDEVLAIERHGQTIGFYIPTGASRQESFVQAVQRLEQTVGQILAETGLSEEELSHLYDLTQPVPDRPREPHRLQQDQHEVPTAAVDVHAAGR